jgi:hypothetical protein
MLWGGAMQLKVRGGVASLARIRNRQVNGVCVPYSPAAADSRKHNP